MVERRQLDIAEIEASKKNLERAKLSRAELEGIDLSEENKFNKSN